MMMDASETVDRFMVPGAKFTGVTGVPGMSLNLLTTWPKPRLTAMKSHLFQLYSF